MIQVAQNGAYGHDDHSDVPVTLEELVADAVACQAAGAASAHLHPRRPEDGAESLAAAVCDPVVAALRQAAPGLELSLSTGEWIALDGAPDRIAAVRSWRTPPDAVSLNLRERESYALGAALLDVGIGIEPGVFDLDDAELLLAAPWADRVTRVLVEIVFEHHADAAVSLARAVDDRVSVLDRPRLWHGDALATWAVVDAGIAAGRDVRVGLEDSLVGRDGSAAPANPAQVRDTIARVPAA